MCCCCDHHSDCLPHHCDCLPHHWSCWPRHWDLEEIFNGCVDTFCQLLTCLCCLPLTLGLLVVLGIAIPLVVQRLPPDVVGNHAVLLTVVSFFGILLMAFPVWLCCTLCAERREHLVYGEHLPLSTSIPHYDGGYHGDHHYPEHGHHGEHGHPTVHFHIHGHDAPQPHGYEHYGTGHPAAPPLYSNPAPAHPSAWQPPASRPPPFNPNFRHE
eukprot:EG_transcript_23856